MNERIMWLSDGFNLMTGFATQTKELLKRYGQKGYDVHYVNSSYVGQKLKKVVYEDGEELNMTLLGGSPRAPYAKDLLQDYLYHYKPQLFGVLLDSFMLAENPANPWILNLNIPCKSTFWFPSDGGWFPRNCEHVLRKFDMPVAMAKHGQQQVKETYGIDCEYVPHGVMTNLFFPLSEQSKMQNRAKWSQRLGIDLSKKFIVGSVFRNQPRKFPDRLIKSFAKFSKDKDDVILLLHTEHADVAAPNDLLFLAQRFGCAHKIFFTGMKSFDAFPTTMMNEIYNLFDVHFLLSSGEGFGIPIVEAMSCGIPNVWTAYTTTKELIMDNNAGFGVRLADEKDEHSSAKTEQLFSGTITGSWEVERGLASIYDAAEKLDRLYKEKSLREEFSKNARNAAVKLYDWDTVVFPKWEKLTRRLL